MYSFIQHFPANFNGFFGLKRARKVGSTVTDRCLPGSECVGSWSKDRTQASGRPAGQPVIPRPSERPPASHFPTLFPPTRLQAAGGRLPTRPGVDRCSLAGNGHHPRPRSYNGPESWWTVGQASPRVEPLREGITDTLSASLYSARSTHLPLMKSCLPWKVSSLCFG